MSTSQQNARPQLGSIPTWTFGDKVRKARADTGLGQKEFAARIGITPSSLGAYETGRTAPRFKDAPTIAKSIQMLTGIPYEWFLVEDAPQGPFGGSKGQTLDYRSEGSAPAPVVVLSEWGAGKAATPAHRGIRA